MRPLPETVVCRFGHVATSSELHLYGASAQEIRDGLASGTIRRIVRGAYACRHTDGGQWDAAAAHSRITCLSALRRAGVWSGLDLSLHLQLSSHASGSRPALDQDGRRIHYHWADPRYPTGGRSWIVGAMEAVWQAIHCLDEEHAIACLESAVHEKYLTEAQVRRICARAPNRLQPGIRDIEFTSGSGQETIARRRLRHAGYVVRAQERIGGLPYDQDLVVEDCVSLETDGKKWHGPDRFHADRNRDLHLEGFGRRALRLTPQSVLYDWETTLTTIERAVADAKRDLRRRTARTVVRLDDPL